MTEEQQGQFAEVRLSMYNWHVVLKLLEREVRVCNSPLQNEAVRLYGAIATQLSDKPVRIVKPAIPRIPREDKPYDIVHPPAPTLKSRAHAWLQHFRRGGEDND